MRYSKRISKDMTEPPSDKFDAVRAMVETLTPFDDADRELIVRWAQESLGMNLGASPTLPHVATPAPPVVPPVVATPGTHGTGDIRTFVANKNPRSDQQFAAVVAYYFRFEAPDAERKNEVVADDLQESARKSGRERFRNPLATLNNAHRTGWLDRGGDRGAFSINAVGENLVAMALPDGDTSAAGRAPRRKKAGKKKKAGRKKTPSKKKATRKKRPSKKTRSRSNN